MRTILKSFILFVPLWGLYPTLMLAQGVAEIPSQGPPPKVQELLQLLDDPSVREWMGQHRNAAGALAPLAPDQEAISLKYFDRRTVEIRHHLAALIAAIPMVPQELARAGGIVLAEIEKAGLVRWVLMIAGIVISGFFAELLYRRGTRGYRNWGDQFSLTTTKNRLRVLGIRFAYDLGVVVAFAIGSIGAFLAMEWPVLLRQVVSGYLLVFLAYRVAAVTGNFLLSPRHGRYRILPMTDAAAFFWHRQARIFSGWLAFGLVTIELLIELGMSVDTRRLVAYLLGLGLVAVALASVWRQPTASAVDAESMPTWSPKRRRIKAWLLSAYAVVLWLLWMISAIPAFWLAVVAFGLPVLNGAMQRAVNQILRPGESEVGAAMMPNVIAASVGRGLRVLLIIGAALLLGWAWKIDFGAIAASDTFATRLLRSAFNAVIIVFVADFAWHFMKVMLDHKLAMMETAAKLPGGGEARRARLRTLLPIMRNVLFVVVLTMTFMMVLASLGVDIGPLIAGAGVVGVAIGFGAQTLVKDVISGVFYLLDDAFRIGEYIQSGNFMGTVESFSLRSIKLRHHRGALYTVPFGELGAIQNLSRDWVIDKFTIGVTYDSDLGKAKKLLKQIGKELAEDPEFAPYIIEPLKMQGVDALGDYGIQIRIKMMTVPGQQFVIRRRAYAMIKEIFAANGIKFSQPSVTIARIGPEARDTKKDETGSALQPLI